MTAGGEPLATGITYSQQVATGQGVTVGENLGIVHVGDNQKAMVVALTEKIYVITEATTYVKEGDLYSKPSKPWTWKTSGESTAMIGQTGDLDYASWVVTRFWLDRDDSGANSLFPGSGLPPKDYMTLLGL